MKAANCFSLLLLIFTLPVQLSAMSPIAEPNWDRAEAISTVDKAGTVDALKPLFQMARAGNDQQLLAALDEIARDTSLQGPQRDYLLFKFTTGLADLDSDSVSPEVIAWLSSYPSETLVAHDDHPYRGVPLYNVRAAAHGVKNHWQRQNSAIEAERLAHEAPDRFVAAYLQAGPASRRGFTDAIEFVSPEKSQQLAESALAQVSANSELTLITVQTALRSGNRDLLRQAIASGGGPEMARAFAVVSAELDAEESAALLSHVLEQESTTKAALAIAQLAPARLDSPAVRDLLFTTLANRDLGASAALVLGASKNKEIQERLSEIASNREGLEKQRAKLAISIEPVAGRAEL